MKNHWRILLQMMPSATEKYFYKRYFSKQHARWNKNGEGGSVSHLSKQKALIEIADKYKIRTLIETGTYFGDMLYALYDNFNILYSVELSDSLYSKAKKRFENKPKIKLVNGDSSTKLNEIMQLINEPALFWLDGHYSGGITAKGEKECPVFEELDTIFSSSLNHAIIIDDARLFVGENDYPTIESLRKYVYQKKASSSMEIINDAIRILP